MSSRGTGSLMLRPYLEGAHFKTQTEHQPLQYILDLKKSKERLARWRFRSAKFDFAIVHRPGKYHEAEDALSRQQKKESERDEVVADVYDNIPTYCILGQISEPNTVSTKREEVVRALATTKELMNAQANDTLF